MSDDPDDLLAMLSRHFRHRLSEWEHEFVTSLLLQRKTGRALTQKQLQKLDEIAERCARTYGR